MSQIQCKAKSKKLNPAFINVKPISEKEFLSAKASQAEPVAFSTSTMHQERPSEMLEGFRLETRSITETNQATLLSDKAHWTRVNSHTCN